MQPVNSCFSLFNQFHKYIVSLSGPVDFLHCIWDCIKHRQWRFSNGLIRAELPCPLCYHCIVVIHSILSIALQFHCFLFCSFSDADLVQWRRGWNFLVNCLCHFENLKLWSLWKSAYIEYRCYLTNLHIWMHMQILLKIKIWNISYYSTYPYYTVFSKKHPLWFLSITSANVDWFSKFLHFQT